MPVATEVSNQWPGKEQVVNDAPKVIKELHFGVLYGVSRGAYQETCSDNSTDPIKTSLISLKLNSQTADCSISTKAALTLNMDL